jgi:peptidase E
MIGGEKMEKKSNHYDGSALFDFTVNNETTNESQQMTDEMRQNISGNPYFFEVNDLKNP